MRHTARIVLAALLLGPWSAVVAQEPRKVTVGAPSPWSPISAAVSFGVQLGFFAAEGIQPELLTFQGSSVLVPQVANKSVTFALVNPDVLVVALDKKEPYPVKFFYNAYRGNVFEFVVKEESPITRLEDLKGQKLGVGAMTWGNIPLSKAVLARAGVRWQRDVEVLPVGMGPTAWQRLQSGQVAALNLFMQEHELMALSGVKLRRLPTPDAYQRNFGAGFIAHVDTMRDDPKLVSGFGRARAKSEVACMANVERCVRAWLTANPALRPPPAEEAAWVERYVHLMKMNFTVTNRFWPDEPKLWGSYTPASWRAVVAMMQEGGQIGDPNLNPDQLYTDAFVQEINRFDRVAVENVARAR